MNKRIGAIKRMFRWAVARELVPLELSHGLDAVENLKKGRTRAPDCAAIEPVPEADVQATNIDLIANGGGIGADTNDVEIYGAGVGQMTNKRFEGAPVQLNGARVTNEGGIQPPVPEPSTGALLGLGIFALSFLGRDRE